MVPRSDGTHWSRRRVPGPTPSSSARTRGLVTSNVSHVIVLIDVPEDRESIQTAPNFPRDLSTMSSSLAAGRTRSMLPTRSGASRSSSRPWSPASRSASTTPGAHRLPGLQGDDRRRRWRPGLRRGGEQPQRERRRRRHHDRVGDDLNGEHALALRPRAGRAERGRHRAARRIQLAFIMALLLKATFTRDRHQPALRSRRSPTPRLCTLPTTRTFTVGDMRDFAPSELDTGQGTSSSRPRRSPDSAPRPGGVSIDVVDTKGTAEPGEAIRTDTMGMTTATSSSLS